MKVIIVGFGWLNCEFLLKGYLSVGYTYGGHNTPIEALLDNTVSTVSVRSEYHSSDSLIEFVKDNPFHHVVFVVRHPVDESLLCSQILKAQDTMFTGANGIKTLTKMYNHTFRQAPTYKQIHKVTMEKTIAYPKSVIGLLRDHIEGDFTQKADSILKDLQEKYPMSYGIDSINLHQKDLNVALDGVFQHYKNQMSFIGGALSSDSKILGYIPREKLLLACVRPVQETLLLTPFLRQYKAKFPYVELTILVPRDHSTYKLLDENPNVASVRYELSNVDDFDCAETGLKVILEEAQLIKRKYEYTQLIFIAGETAVEHAVHQVASEANFILNTADLLTEYHYDKDIAETMFTELELPKDYIVVNRTNDKGINSLPDSEVITFLITHDLINACTVSFEHGYDWRNAPIPLTAEILKRAAYVILADPLLYLIACAVGVDVDLLSITNEDFRRIKPLAEDIHVPKISTPNT